MSKIVIGFLAFEFHSEVIEYLLELYEKTKTTETIEYIIYNNGDQYGNIDLYKEKYNNISIKCSSEFIPDMTNDIVDKIYVISYSNIMHPILLEKYAKKLIFIAHSQKDIHYLQKFSHLTLTSGLCKHPSFNYTLPICKNTQLQELNTTHVNNFSDVNIFIIGLFLENNKNQELITYLLKNKANLHIFSTIPTHLLNTYSQEYKDKDNLHIYYEKTTKEIVEIVNSHKNSFIGFFPKQDSSFFSNQWSGSIAFSYNNNIPIIVPEEITKLHQLKGNVSYNNTDDILENIVKYINNKDQNILEYNKFKNDIFERNKLILSIIKNEQFDKNVKLALSEYGPIYILYNDVIGQKLIKNDYHEKNLIIKTEELLQKYQDDEITIIDVGSNIGTTVSGFLHTNKNANVISLEAQSYLAQIQKKTMLLNNVIDRVKIYNNAAGHKCISNINMSKNFCLIDSIDSRQVDVNYDDEKVRNYGGLQIGKDGEQVDMISIDSLELQNVRLIKIDVEGAERLVIYGGRRTIEKYKPIIVYEDNWKDITADMIETLKLPNVVQNFDIPKFLESLGYKKSDVQVIDDNHIWIHKE